MEFTLRKYQSSDSKEIFCLFYDTVHAINIKEYSQEQVDVWAPRHMPSSNMQQALEIDISYVVDYQGMIVGFATLSNEGMLGHLYTHKDFQGKGIASALLLKLEDVSRMLNSFEIQTYASITAKPFF